MQHKQMNETISLFDSDETVNVLPVDGHAYYHGRVFEQASAENYLESLLHTIPWKNDEVLTFGKRFITARKVAWLGDLKFSYAYSGTIKKATAWTPELLQIKSVVEKIVGEEFNSCLLNLYNNGSEGMGWHSDDEKCFGCDPTIASVSFGATRKFAFRHKTQSSKVPIFLNSGSLLVMKGKTQQYWQHALLKSTTVEQPRINLTFRKIVDQG